MTADRLPRANPLDALFTPAGVRYCVQHIHIKMAAGPAVSPLLLALGELADVNAEVRRKAAASLVKHLHQSQREFEEAGAKLGSLPSGSGHGAAPCCNDLQYALQRLLKGLSSPHGGARLGFSLALTEVLRDFPNIRTADALDKLLQSTAISQKMNPSEQRDHVLGRLVGSIAFQKSGRLQDAGDAGGAGVAAAVKLATELLQIANKRSWLADVAFEGLAAILSGISLQAWSKHVSAVLLPAWPAAAEEWSANHVALACTLEQCWAAWHATGSSGAAAAAAAAAALPAPVQLLQQQLSADVLRRHVHGPWTGAGGLPFAAGLVAAAGVFPALHPVWGHLFRRYLPSLDTSSSGSSSGSATSNVAGDGDAAGFEVLWRVAVDGLLMGSGGPPSRRATGFALLTALLPAAAASPATLDVVLSPRLLRALTGQLSNRKQVLHAAAKATVTTILAACHGKPAASSTAMLALSTRAHASFDKITHTQTVATLMAQLDDAAVLKHVLRFVAAFVQPAVASATGGSGRGDGGDDDGDTAMLNDADADISAVEMAKRQRANGGAGGAGGGADSDDDDDSDDSEEAEGSSGKDARGRGGLSAVDKERLHALDSVVAAVRNPALPALRTDAVLRPLLSLLGWHCFAAVQLSEDAEAQLGSAAAAAASDASAAGVLRRAAVELQCGTLVAAASSSPAAAAPLLRAQPPLSEEARSMLRTRVLGLVQDLASQQAAPPPHAPAAAAGGAGAGAGAGSAAAPAAAPVPAPLARWQGLSDRQSASLDLGAHLALCVNGGYDAAVTAASAGAEGVGLALFPPPYALGSKGESDDDEDDDEEQSGGSDDEDAEDEDAEEEEEDEGEDAAEVRTRALTLSKHLRTAAHKLLQTGADANVEHARALLAFASLFAHVSAAMLLEAGTSGDAAAALADLLGAAAPLLHNHAVAADAAAAKAAAATAPGSSSKDKKSKKDKSSDVASPASAAAVVSLVTALAETRAAVASAAADDDDDEHDHNHDHSHGGADGERDMLVFVDSCLSLLANCGTALREAIKAAARAVFTQVTPGALQPILDLVGTGLGSAGGGGAGEEDDGDDDDDEDGDGEGSGGEGGDDSDDESVTLDASTGAALLLGESAGSSSSKKGDAKPAQTGQKRKRQDEDDEAEDGSDSDDDDNDDSDSDQSEEKQGAAAEEEMQRYDRMLENMLRLRHEKKGSEKASRQRAGHFRNRALDLLDVAINRLASGGGGSGSGSSGVAQPALMQLLLPLLQTVRKVAARVRAKETTGNSAGAAESSELLQRLLALLSKASRAKFPSVVDAATAPQYAAAGVTADSQLQLLQEVCRLVVNAPTVAFTEAATQVANAILRTLRDTAATTTTASATAAYSAVPALSVLDRVRACYAGVVESYLAERHPRVHASFFRNLLITTPPLAVGVLVTYAKCIADGSVTKAFKLAEAYGAMAGMVRACAAPAAADLPAATKADKADKAGDKKAKAEVKVITVRKALQRVVPSIAGAIASTLSACAAAAAAGGAGAPLSAKHIKEPLELLKALHKAELLNAQDGEAGAQVYAAVTAVAEKIAHPGARGAAERALEAAGLPVPVPAPAPSSSASKAADDDSDDDAAGDADADADGDGAMSRKPHSSSSSSGKGDKGKHAAKQHGQQKGQQHKQHQQQHQQQHKHSQGASGSKAVAAPHKHKEHSVSNGGSGQPQKKKAKLG